jgi:oligopeptide/dipeptide ABC transporter ATP-binding protein
MSAENPSIDAPLIQVKGLSKTFAGRTGITDRFARRAPNMLYALDDINLTIYRGEILGLVGESGSGKTTLGRCLLRLVEPSKGEILYRGQDVVRMNGSQMQAMRRKMQMIFQDPYSSLNPRMTIHDTLAEVLTVHRIVPPAEVDGRVRELLRMVGLPADAAVRYPRHFSGGQRQRIGIARAIAMGPEFIVADEPVSAVDVSIQAQVLSLLLDLKVRLGLTVLFISHDLSVVQYVSNRVAVMYLGKLVEVAPSKAIYAKPLHPYTLGLLLSAPQPDPNKRTTSVAVEGDPPSPMKPPPGCRFHTRCFLATELCKQKEPNFQDVGGGHYVACHYYEKMAQRPPFVREIAMELPISKKQTAAI